MPRQGSEALNAVGQGDERIVRAAERLVTHWRVKSDGGLVWGHKGYWFPVGSEKQAKALINAVLAKRHLIDGVKEP